jgi:hypothetical protein
MIDAPHPCGQEAGEEAAMGSRIGAGTRACGIAASFVHAFTILGLVFGEYGYAVAATSENAPDTAPPSAGLSDDDLVELVGPIALYPDELLAITLPASTYPLQIVQAARFLEKHEKNPDLKPDEDWDESIIGLLNYPEVINLMNEDLDWTWKLGEAVANQQDDIMWAVQSFRGKADEAGNLESNDKVTVEKEEKDGDQVIIIESTSPEVIYVPQYQPSTVIVYQTTPYPWYWSRPYPYYYRPAAAFWTGMFVGAAVGWGMRWGWGRGHSHVNVNRNVNVNVNRPTRPNRPSQGDRPGGGGGDRWKPEKGPGNQAGGRPGQGAGGKDRPSTGQRPTGGDRAGDRKGGGDRAGAGDRKGGGDRAGAGDRKGGGDRAGAGDRKGGGDRAGAGSRESRSSTGSRQQKSGSRDSASRSSQQRSGRSATSSRSTRGSSMGSYGSGSRTRSNASRGSSSRGGSRGGGHSRGGGGRGGGGGRRR